MFPPSAPKVQDAFQLIGQTVCMNGQLALSLRYSQPARCVNPTGYLWVHFIPLVVWSFYKGAHWKCWRSTIGWFPLIWPVLISCSLWLFAPALEVVMGWCEACLTFIIALSCSFFCPCRMAYKSRFATKGAPSSVLGLSTAWMLITPHPFITFISKCWGEPKLQVS